MFKRVMQKTAFAFTAFGAGVIWGMAAEASAAGIPLIGLFQG